MEIKLIVSGKEIKAQISDEDLQRIQQKNTESRFERANYGEDFYYLTDLGNVMSGKYAESAYENQLWEIGNYFKTAKQAQDHIRALKLWQAIKVFRQEREGGEWSRGEWYVVLQKSTGKLICGQNEVSFDQSTRFLKKETAQAVIDEFYGELMWYFTEFHDD